MGEISFTKMQGAGNDFILVREEDLPRALGSEIGDLARKICDRRFGIGADGLMVASCKRDGIQMRYCNADGSPAAVCGNGLRCFARYASEQQLVKEDRFVVQTDAGAKRSSCCGMQPGRSAAHRWRSVVRNCCPTRSRRCFPAAGSSTAR